MNFIQAIISVIGKYSIFSGRASRREFWFFHLAYCIVMVSLFLITSVLYGGTLVETGATLVVVEALYWVAAMCYWVVFCGTITPMLAVSSRRLHDTNRSGWLQVIFFLPWFICILLGGWIEGSNESTLYYELSALLDLVYVLLLIGIIITVGFWIRWMAKDSVPYTNRYGDIPADKARKMFDNTSYVDTYVSRIYSDYTSAQTAKPKFCTSCGESVASRFCGNCGTAQ